jgi:hypothetical protein
MNMTTLDQVGEDQTPDTTPADESADIRNAAYVQAIATAIVRHAEIAARAMEQPMSKDKDHKGDKSKRRKTDPATTDLFDEETQ